MKVALVYDRVNKWGGAERVLLAFKKIFPEADLFTSVYNKNKASWAKVFNIKTSFLQRIPFASSSHEFYAVLMPLAFESLDFTGYDLIISVTSESAKGIITKPDAIHICYCLTPTRYLWSGYNYYFKNPLLSFFAKPAVWYLRKWDKIASQRPDYYIAISKEVQARIKKYYNRDSEIIYPPLMLGNSSKAKSKNRGDYFLVVSRLTNFYKRVDIAVEACSALRLPLKVIGTGRDEINLKRSAGPTVEFLGRVSDEKLTDYYKNCKALIFPAAEDFGLAMVEAQAFGRPVIAFKSGGALDIIQEGKTGEFFSQQTASSLKSVLENFDDTRYNTKLCKDNVQKFSYDNFEAQFNDFLKKII